MSEKFSSFQKSKISISKSWKHSPKTFSILLETSFLINCGKLSIISSKWGESWPRSRSWVVQTCYLQIHIMKHKQLLFIIQPIRISYLSTKHEAFQLEPSHIRRTWVCRAFQDYFRKFSVLSSSFYMKTNQRNRAIRMLL